MVYYSSGQFFLIKPTTLQSIHTFDSGTTQYGHLNLIRCAKIGTSKQDSSTGFKIQILAISHPQALLRRHSDHGSCWHLKMADSTNFWDGAELSLLLLRRVTQRRSGWKGAPDYQSIAQAVPTCPLSTRPPCSLRRICCLLVNNTRTGSSFQLCRRRHNRRCSRRPPKIKVPA